MPNINLPEDFPVRLNRLRKDHFLSETELAQKSGLTYKTIRELEKGNRERIMERTLLVLADALGVSPAVLLHGEKAAVPELENPSKSNKTGLIRRIGFFAAAVFLFLSLVFALLFWIGRSSAEFEFVSGIVVVRDSVFGIPLWGKEHSAGITFCNYAPWDGSSLLVGLGKTTPGGGVVLCLDKATGKTIWSVGPELGQIEAAFGAEIVQAANFYPSKVNFGDLNGDGEDDLIICFNHGLYYPSSMLWINRHGETLGQYSNKGHLSDILVVDFDDDGCDEVVACGTNNSRQYQGGTIVLLDQKNWSGHSTVGGADPNPLRHPVDGSKLRLIFPAFPENIMTMIGAPRLACWNMQAYKSPAKKLLLNVTMGGNRLSNMVLTLDANLIPIGVRPSDTFTSTMASWADDLGRKSGPGNAQWLAKWLAGHHRFENGNLVLQ